MDSTHLCGSTTPLPCRGHANDNVAVVADGGALGVLHLNPEEVVDVVRREGHGWGPAKIKMLMIQTVGKKAGLRR